MNSTAFCILASAILVHVILVIVLLHSRLPIPPVGIHVSSAACSYAFMHLCLWLYECLATYWLCMAALAFAAMIFLFGYSAVYKSLSLRVLVRLSVNHTHMLDMTWVTERVMRRSFDERARMLAAAGMVECNPEGVRLTEKGAKMAVRLGAIREFFGARPDGLYFSAPIPREKS